MILPFDAVFRRKTSLICSIVYNIFFILLQPESLNLVNMWCKTHQMQQITISGRQTHTITSLRRCQNSRQFAQAKIQYEVWKHSISVCSFIPMMFHLLETFYPHHHHGIMMIKMIGWVMESCPSITVPISRLLIGNVLLQAKLVHSALYCTRLGTSSARLYCRPQ